MRALIEFGIDTRAKQDRSNESFSLSVDIDQERNDLLDDHADRLPFPIRGVEDEISRGDRRIAESLEQAAKQVILAFESLIEESDGRSRSPHDLGNRSLLETFLRDDFFGRIEKTFEPLLAPRLFWRRHPVQLGFFRLSAFDGQDAFPFATDQTGSLLRCFILGVVAPKPTERIGKNGRAVADVVFARAVNELVVVAGKLECGRHLLVREGPVAVRVIEIL